MAQKSKTQRARASAARAAKKEQARKAEEAALNTEATQEEPAEERKKSFRGRRAERIAAEEAAREEAKKAALARKAKEPEKKKRFQFFRDVKAEMKRITWPTKQDVLRWSVVVVAALLFFGIYVAVLDNVIITPALVGISSIPALF